MAKIMRTLVNISLPFIIATAVTIVNLAIASCEKKRNGIDYHFDQKGEGWYFLLYEQPGERELRTLQGRNQIDYRNGNRLVVTSSKPDFGWAQDRFYLNGREVSSSSLGGVHPSRFVTVKKQGMTLKYKEFYLGDFQNIASYNDPKEILLSLLKLRGNH